MSDVRSSYEFHRQIESFPTFFRREWRPIALFGGGFCIVMLAVIIFIDPAFFYPRLQTDPLNYWLKAKSLVDNGNTAARWAVNLRPFSYAAMPGVLRAPMLLVFDEFDQQLRAIQILNIPIAALVALFSGYVFSWALPVRRHWMAICFAFAFTLLNPVWINNVFLPLADAPYALFTLLAFLVSVSIFAADKPVREQRLMLALYAVLFLIAFLLRFTAPVLMVVPLALAAARWHPAASSRKHLVGAAVVIAVAIVVLVGLNADAIFQRYGRELVGFTKYGNKTGMFLNFLGAAVPAQVLPNFLQGFVHPPIVSYYNAVFFSSGLQAAWLGFGLLIGAVVLTGIWQARSRFLPEVLYFLASAPILGLMMPSTSRYLKAYQAFVWIFFYVGAAYIYRRWRGVIPSAMRTRAFGAATLAAALLLIAAIRVWRLGGTASEKKFAVTAGRAAQYIGDVATTFRGLRGYIETLPRDKVLLMSDRGSMGRWKVISGRDYYYPDTAMAAMAAKKDLYLVVECGTMEACQYWDDWRGKLEDRVTQFGSFEYDSVYAIARPRARAEVYRVKNFQFE